MLDLVTFQTWDLQVLHFFNTTLESPFNDALMRFLSAEWPWFSLALVLAVRAIVQKNWAFLKLLIWIGLTIGLSDFIAAQALKPWVERIRPCKVAYLVRIVDSCSGNLGFPSNHATNGAVFATLWLLCMGWRQGMIAIVGALLVGLSRVYLGVHYPSDILGGFLLGTSIALCSYLVLSRTQILPGLEHKAVQKG